MQAGQPETVLSEEAVTVPYQSTDHSNSSARRRSRASLPSAGCAITAVPRKGAMERMEKIVMRTASIIGNELQPLNAQFLGAALRKLHIVCSDDRHPLHQAIASCESTRESSVFEELASQDKSMRDSLLPTAIRLFNLSV